MITQPRRKGIKTSSAKAKGRKLQDLVRDAILHKFPILKKDGDVRGAVMGENGEDIKMSPRAKRLFPFSVECKARKSFVGYTWFDQAVTNAGDLTPLLVVKADRKEPLVIMKLSDFMEII